MPDLTVPADAPALPPPPATTLATNVAVTPPSISNAGALTPGSVETTVKPGKMTTEFFVTLLIALIGTTMASGLIVNNTAIQVAGLAVALLKTSMYTWSRTMIKTAGILVLLAFGLHTTTACGANARLTTLRTTYGALKLAKTSLVTYQRDSDDAIIKAEPDRATAMAKLAANDAKVDKVEHVIDDGVTAVADAALIDSGDLAPLIALVPKIWDELKALGAKTP